MIRRIKRKIDPYSQLFCGMDCWLHHHRNQFCAQKPIFFQSEKRMQEKNDIDSRVNRLSNFSHFNPSAIALAYVIVDKQILLQLIFSVIQK
jgi:hypothetical protein